MKPNYQKIVIIISILIILFSLAFKIYSISTATLGFDEAGISYIANEMTSGSKIYTDYFDHKPPFMHYLLSFIFNFLEPSTFSIKLIALIFDLVLGLTIFFVALKLTDKTHALLSAAIYSIFNLSLSLNTEIVMSIFGLLGLLFYMKALGEKKLTNKNLFLAGIFIAISIWFKQSALFFYVPIVAHMIYLRYKKSISGRELLNSFVFFTLAVLLISIPLLSFFLYRIGGDFLYSLIGFNLDFNAASSRILQIGKGLNILFLYFGFLLTVTLSYLFTRGKKEESTKTLSVLISFSILILIFIFISPEIFYQHFFQLIPFAILLSTFAIFNSDKKTRTIFFIVILVGVAIISLSTLEAKARELRENPLAKQSEILNYLKENVPQDSLFFSDNPVYTLLGGYKVNNTLVGVAPTFASVFNYSFICDREYLVLTHRRNFLPKETNNCINENFSMEKRFENIGESYVEVWKRNSIS